jgi:hypothetical protein
LPKSLIYRTALLYLEAAQRASTGSPPCLPLREAYERVYVTGTALLYLEAAQRASTGSPVPLPLREAASRLRDGDRLFGGLVSPRRQVDSPRRHRRASGFRNGRTPRIRRLCVSPIQIGLIPFLCEAAPNFLISYFLAFLAVDFLFLGLSPKMIRRSFIQNWYKLLNNIKLLA